MSFRLDKTWMYLVPTLLHAVWWAEEYPPPQDVYILIPKMCKYVKLHGKGGLMLLMDLRLLIS